MKTRDKQVLHMARVCSTPMNIRTRGQITGQTTGWKKEHGRTLVKDVTEKTSVLQTFHPDQPRAGSPINDNYCVKVLQAGLLAGSKPPTPERTVNCMLPKTFVNSVVVNPVLTAPRLSQQKDISPSLSGCYQSCKLNYVKDVFCVDQNVFCKTCNKCLNCCLKSACRD